MDRILTFAKYCEALFVILGLFAVPNLPAQEQGKTTVDIGSRTEMFVDDWLIEKQTGVHLQLQTPIKREVVLTTDMPWEGSASAYFTVIQDGALIRLYYRGTIPVKDNDTNQVTCYAESRDGIHFTRPNLGLFDVQGSKSNNVVLMGVEAHNFAPFRDLNPAAKPDERYKALGGGGGRLFAFASPDGIHWKKVQKTAVLTKGAFDSLNISFWNEPSQQYWCYSRYYEKGVRAIQRTVSTNFTQWTKPEPNHYAVGVPWEHFYTSATLPCPGAPHIYLAFPKRFVPGRTKIAEANAPGVSDAMFMSSRDGINWDRSFLEAWVRPDLDPKNWTHRNNMPAWGIVQLQPDEYSMYISEHYEWPDNRLRRITVRRDGFASVHADAKGGEFTTRPVVFSGKSLLLNYATSAAGSIQVEVLDDKGAVLPGFALKECKELFGNELDAGVSWNEKPNLADVVGKPVRFHFVLKDADLFALCTR